MAEEAKTKQNFALAKAKILPRKYHLSAVLAKDLPECIVEDILSRLPVKSLLRFRSVATPWLSLITDSQFVRTHLERCTTQNLMIKEYFTEKIDTEFKIETYFRNNVFRNFKIHEMKDGFHEFLEKDGRLSILVKKDTEMIGSCDGLLCINSMREIMSDVGGIICILNPFTREFKRLPVTPTQSPQDVFDPVSYGFGYDPSIDDYKVVCIAYVRGYGVQVFVYTLGLSDSWRRITSVPSNEVFWLMHGVYLNGDLHWTHRDRSSAAKSTIAFDLAQETFKQMPLPNCRTEIRDISLAVLGGCLHVLLEFINDQIDVWAMKAYGVEESWTKLFVIPQAPEIGSVSVLTPLWFSKNGELLLERFNVLDACDLIMYDPKREEVRRLDEICEEFEACSYVGSLVSLKSDDAGQGENEGGDEEWKAEAESVPPIVSVWKD